MGPTDHHRFLWMRSLMKKVFQMRENRAAGLPGSVFFKWLIQKNV